MIEIITVSMPANQYRHLHRLDCRKHWTTRTKLHALSRIVT